MSVDLEKEVKRDAEGRPSLCPSCRYPIAHSTSGKDVCMVCGPVDREPPVPAEKRFPQKTEEQARRERKELDRHRQRAEMEAKARQQANQKATLVETLKAMSAEERAELFKLAK